MFSAEDVGSCGESLEQHWLKNKDMKQFVAQYRDA